MANSGWDNITPLSQRTEEEKQNIAQMGGKASGEARRKKKEMREMLEMCLELKNNKGLTYRQLATMGLINGAIKGNAQNYRTILETLGELEAIKDDRMNDELTKVEELLTKIKEEASK